MINNPTSNIQSLPHGYELQGEKNKYIIDHTLGQGAFGITYLAKYKTQVTGQMGTGTIWAEVAIKEFFMRDLSSRVEETKNLLDSTENSIVSRYRRAFLREAKNLSKIRHPNIVNVFEVIETNNTAYIIMEYVNGDNLDNYIINHGRLTEDKALHLFHPLCEAMNFMHEQRMLHLDIKPKNVMIDEEGHPYLIDFGLSKQYTQEGEPESSTSIGLGTPGYAPIEQAEQRDGDKTFRTTIDIYALGGTLFKMLKGDTPPKASEISESFLDGENIIKEELMAVGVSSKIASCISKAMHPSSRKRYQNVMEFASDLGLKIEETKETLSVQERTIQEEQPIYSEETIIIAPNNTILTPNTSSLLVPNEPPAITPKITTPSAIRSVLYPTDYDFTDLGLSVLWASHNIGANKAEEFGDYYAWGETKPKDEYSLENYSFRIKGDSWQNVQWSKYHFQQGTFMAQENAVLEKEDDAAFINWGSNWQIPSDKEWQELIDNCHWVFLKQAEIWGYMITSKKNGTSIFLPAAGNYDEWKRKNDNNHDKTISNSNWNEGFYWSSSLFKVSYWYGKCIRINSYGVKFIDDHRYFGHSIRPIFRHR